MAIADNVAEIIRRDRQIEEMVSKEVIPFADMNEYRWLR